MRAAMLHGDADGRVSGSSSVSRVPMPVFVVGGLALVKLALHLATNGQYGYHRDDLIQAEIEVSATDPAACAAGRRRCVS
jgi:hypothetical protein